MINSSDMLVQTESLSILFAEDYDDLRESTAEILKNFFAKVDSVADGEEALTMYKNYHKEESKYYDIVLTDIRMPKLNGVELTKEIYDINPSQMVVVVSAFDETQYLLPLVNMGIEQFIKKPINYNNLLGILLNTSKKINLKKIENKLFPSKIQLDENTIFDREKKSLLNKKEVVYLTKYEIIFMQLLTSNVGSIFSNEDIVFEYNLLEENLDIQNIRKLVSKLRKKLPSNCIESIYGVGYRLVPYFS